MGQPTTLGAGSLGSSLFMPTGGTQAGSMMGSMALGGMTIKDIKEPNFRRDLTKNEANILPDKGSTIKITGKKRKHVEANPYEQ